MLAQQLQKLLGNISGDITGEWWIKSYDVPTALLFRVGWDYTYNDFIIITAC